MDLKSFADNCAHAHPGIQRRIGILKDQLHLAPQMAQLRTRKRGQVTAVEEHAASRRLEELENQSSQRRFAGAGFAD